LVSADALASAAAAAFAAASAFNVAVASAAALASAFALASAAALAFAALTNAAPVAFDVAIICSIMSALPSVSGSMSGLGGVATFSSSST
jgi:hypothetical protein